MLDGEYRLGKDAPSWRFCRLPWGGAFLLAFGVLANAGSRTGGQPIFSFRTFRFPNFAFREMLLFPEAFSELQF
jgi:hypothetical protein